jgi:hypothetical protein
LHGLAALLFGAVLFALVVVTVDNFAGSLLVDFLEFL